MKPKSDLERYQQEQRQILEDLAWRASEDSLVETLIGRFRVANIGSAIGTDLARHMLVSRGLNADIADRVAERIGNGLAEVSSSN
jgi:hypothetical protein